MFNPILVHDWLRRTAGRLPGKTALVCGRERWSYAELDGLSDRLAAALSARGLRRGDRVLIFLENSAETVIALYGALKAGGVFSVLNPAMKGPKLGYIVRDSEAAVLVAGAEKEEVVRQALNGVERPPRVVFVGRSGRTGPMAGAEVSIWDELLGAGGNLVDAGPPRCRADMIDLDLAALIYTSGSTGDPKGVMSSHRNIVAVARSIITYLENAEEDIVLNVLPLSFDYGLYQVLMAVMFGGTVVLERSFLFPVRVLERIGKEGVTGFPVVPSMAAMILKLQNLERLQLSTLRYMTNTAAALPVEHIRRLTSLFPGVRFFSMFGLTECKRVSYIPPEELVHRPASVGKAIPNCETMIVDAEGCEVPPGEIGELVVRGSNVMMGYWNAPELTAKTFRSGRLQGEKLLHTGDLFRKDEEGYLYFVGRRDDMIKSRGERVSPREVENVICSLDGVAEAAVVGVPDEVLGEAIIAFVVLRDGVEVAEKDIMRHCAANLEPFCVPKLVEFRAALPKTANGKVDKKALKQQPPSDSFLEVAPLNAKRGKSLKDEEGIGSDA